MPEELRFDVWLGSMCGPHWGHCFSPKIGQTVGVGLVTHRPPAFLWPHVTTRHVTADRPGSLPLYLLIFLGGSFVNDENWRLSSTLAIKVPIRNPHFFRTQGPPKWVTEMGPAFPSGLRTEPRKTGPGPSTAPNTGVQLRKEHLNDHRDCGSSHCQAGAACF